MLDIQYLKYVLAKMGLIPDVLILGGWLYVTILLIVLLYYFLCFVKRVLFGARK
ncbi:hypothetical protein PIPA1_16550 [Pelosinus sp. IPA-1]|nr:hypothetical protein PIPA1_16550 [Pelosinus sp. IPA-1]